MAPDSRSKLSRTLIARVGLVDRWIADASQVRDRTRPLAWFHAPSVGEGLQARPIIEALRRARPEVQIAYSFFSPSAESFAKTLPVDIANYLPFDSDADAHALMDALAPTALFFVKLDVWPKLVSVAKRKGVRVGLLSGTVAPASRRQGTLSRAILHEAYAALDVVGAIDAANGERLRGLGVANDRLCVSGDTRFDQVWKRAEAVDRQSALLRALQSDQPTLVAGSTWPADEAVLLAAWPHVKRRVANARLIIAPHEPTPEHLQPILEWAREQELSVALLRELVEPNAAKVTSTAPATVTATATLTAAATATATATPTPTPTATATLEATAAPTPTAIAAAPAPATARANPDLIFVSNSGSTNVDVVVVDRVGVLGDIYAVADVAFVGGAFHTAGLHSVLEPAAYGVPVVFGPSHSMSREAGLLLQQDGARSVATREQCEAVIVEWLANKNARAMSGARAKEFVQSELGAADRSLQLVLRAITR